MKKEKTAWAVSLILIAFLAIQLPGSVPPRDEDYAFVRTLVDIHRQVADRYVDNVDAEKLHQGAINGMLDQLDPYTVYVSPKQQKAFDQMLDGQFEGVGLQLSQKENGEVEVITPIDDSPAFKAGVLAGDVILKVNGESLTDKRLEQVTALIQGKASTTVTLHIRRGKTQELDLSMQRQQIIMPTIKGYRRNPDNSWDYYADPQEKLAYVRISQFTGDTYEKFKAVIDSLLASGMKGLVLDMRMNPGGRLDSATDVIDLFLDQGVIVSTRGRGRPEETVFAKAKGTLPRFPLVILVNGSSASAAEVVAGSLKDNGRALVIGERTYGKGSVQELIRLGENSGELKLTVAYYYLPSGRLVHRKKDATDWGVIPHIEVKVDPATEQKIMRERYETELLRRPGTSPSTSPTTQPFGSDIQLKSAVEHVMSLMVLQKNTGTLTIPATMPTRPEPGAGTPLPPED